MSFVSDSASLIFVMRGNVLTFNFLTCLDFKGAVDAEFKRRGGSDGGEHACGDEPYDAAGSRQRRTYHRLLSRGTDFQRFQ